ncbi:hypothetical protein L7F22_059539 [Adiantum nelumboides]|nr:hypothetical protein [Adiantum nelumboides]
MCSQIQFQEPRTKLWLFDTLVALALLYGVQIWGPSLNHHGRSDRRDRTDGWRGMERPPVSMISQLIRAKALVPHDIIRAELAAPPLVVEALTRSALKSVAKFVNNHSLKGAVVEVGLLCSAVVYANPSSGVSELMRPIMMSLLSSFEECPSTGFSGVPNSQAVFDLKTTLSPALETSIVYWLNLISMGLMYGGEHVIECKDLVKRIITASFDAPSAKVNEAGTHLLNAVFRSVIHYYPLDQYRRHKTYANMEGVEQWLSTKADSGLDKEGPIWHVPSQTEIGFADELLEMHLKGALTELKSICLRSYQENAGILAKEKEHLRVVLLRIDSSLRGVQSCLPDFRSSAAVTDNGEVEPYFISGAIGASVGSAHLREEAADILHLACNYCMKVWTDDIVILSLLAHSIAAVGDSGSLEFLEWSSAKGFCETELKSLSEPPTNFLTGQFVKGHRRPKWLVIELVILHNTWRASQAEYNRYRAAGNGNQNPPKHAMLLIKDLTSLSLHSYDAVRKMAAASLRKVFKRFPSSMNEQLPELLNSLKDPLVPEHAALGSCDVLASRTISRHLTEDFGFLSSFFLAILSSGHHGSIKAQNAINELFGKFVLRFGGLPLHNGQDKAEVGFSDDYKGIVKEIQSFCSNRDFTHWRYILMAQGMLLLLSAHGPGSSCCQGCHDANVQNNIIGHFLLNLKSDFPPLRHLSIGSLLFLLQPSCSKRADLENDFDMEAVTSSLKPKWVSVLAQGDFGNVVLRNLSIDHHFSSGEMRSRQGAMGGVISLFNESTMSMLWVPGNMRAWPRTRTVDAVMNGDGFSAKNAKLFKRLVQNSGLEVLEDFRGPLQEALNNTDERGLQCAAAEVIAGFLHSDTDCVLKAWDEWLQPLFKKFLISSSVEAITEWAACIRFAATGKGQLGRGSPLTRPMVLSCLLDPLPSTSSSNSVYKYFTFACAALSELPPSGKSSDELSYSQQLLLEALRFIRHSAPQVREAVGLAISIAGGNVEAHNVSRNDGKVKVLDLKAVTSLDVTDWKAFITSQTLLDTVMCQRVSMQANEVLERMENVLPASNTGSNAQDISDLQKAVRFTETVLYFLISTMKSGRSKSLIDLIVELLQPVLSLQDVHDARDEVWSFVRPVVSENMQIATMRPFSLHEYWDLISQPLQEGLQHIFYTGCMRQCMSSGIISLIPKGGDASTLRQWRPITLMSSVYKILARTIRAQLRPLLPDLIRSSQTGFAQVRSILDNVVTFYETVEWARVTEQPTVIMLLDFEKAYDKVDWGVLEGTLSRMGFPDAWM